MKDNHLNTKLDKPKQIETTSMEVISTQNGHHDNQEKEKEKKKEEDNNKNEIKDNGVDVNKSNHKSTKENDNDNSKDKLKESNKPKIENQSEDKNENVKKEIKAAAVTDEAIEPIEEIDPIQVKPKRRRTKHKKQDSRIDVKDLMKFENFTQKMDEKPVGLIINLKIKSMETQFPMIKVEIDQNLTVLELKNKIYEASPDKIHALRQRIIHKGRLIKDTRTLKHYNISDGQTLMLVRSRRNQTKGVNSNANKNGKERFNPRQRAMTLGAPNPMQIRSQTPEPSASQMY